MPYPTKKLGDVCDVFADGDWIETKDQSLSGIRLIQTGNVGEGFFVGKEGKKSRFITESTFKRLNCTEIFPGDLLISRLPDPVGRSCVVPDINMRMITAVDCTIVRANEKEVLQKFLLFVTNSSEYHAQIRGNLSGTTRQRISRGSLEKIKIPLPPLATQKQIVERLDKIAEAQKLNDDLIQKTDELFQSLLHKELNPTGRNWIEDKFVNCIEKNPLKIKGIPREKYQSAGKFPIIDQSDKFIVGYTDDKDKVNKIDSPVIIFGDHTRIFKYIDFDFAIGADGTQIIIPGIKIFIPKFFYFLMLNLKINNLGYSRHFKILKTKKIVIPPLETQKRIVAKLSAVQEYKGRLLEQKFKLKELFESALHNAFRGSPR